MKIKEFFFGKKKEPSKEEIQAHINELQARIRNMDPLPYNIPEYDKPVEPKREKLFSAMKDDLSFEVSQKMMDLKNIGNRLRNEQNLLSQEADGLINGLEAYKTRMDQLKAQLEKGADQLEELWVQINFECEYLGNIINYSKKNKVRRQKLPQEYANDKANQKQSIAKSESSEPNNQPQTPNIEKVKPQK
jgi:hypothetical protein